MTAETLQAALALRLPSRLAAELAEDYLHMRQDVLTQTLGRGAPGRFVESTVQALQFLEKGKYAEKPNVEEFLRTLETRETPLDDSLKLCLSRLARAMYAIRSKRDIVHKNGGVAAHDDLALLEAVAKWVIIELLRQPPTRDDANDVTIRASQFVRAPVGAFVEDVGGRRLINGAANADDEVLLFIHSFHPQPVTAARVAKELNRRGKSTVYGSLKKLWDARLLDGDSSSGYILTSSGLRRVVELANELARAK